MENTLYLGLDVHKDSLTIAIAAAGRKGEVRLYGAISNDLHAIEKALTKISHINEKGLATAGDSESDLQWKCFHKRKRGIRAAGLQRLVRWLAWHTSLGMLATTLQSLRVPDRSRTIPRIASKRA